MLSEFPRKFKEANDLINFVRFWATEGSIYMNLEANVSKLSMILLQGHKIERKSQKIQTSRQFLRLQIKFNVLHFPKYPIITIELSSSDLIIAKNSIQ